MKKRLLMLLILSPIYQISLYSMQQTQIQLRVDKNKLDVPYDFVTKQLGFLPKEMFDIMQMETDPTTEEKYIDVSPLLSPEEFNLLQKLIPVILPKQNLSVKTLIDQRVFDQLINQSNWPSVYTLADKTNFALLQRYLSYYIAQLYVDKKIDLNTILNLAPTWHSPIAKYYFLITKKDLPEVNKNSYGFSIQELIDWGYDFRQHYIATNQRLNLNNLRINSLDGFDNISGIKINHLQNLNLSANQLTYLPANFLANASRLFWLDLEQNQLQQLPVNFLANAPQLQILGLEQNKLSSLPANFLVNAPQLFWLDLSQNKLTSLPENFLANAPALQQLVLNQNQLRSLPANFLANAPALQGLYLFQNQLTSLPANFLVNAPALLRLSLDQNQLRSLPDNFLVNAPALQGLYLSQNQLTSLPANFLVNAPALQGLYLSQNQLRSLPANFLVNAPALQGLYLSQNQLSSLPDNFLVNAPALQGLYLSQNQLSSLPANFLANAPQLSYLHLSANQLSSLPANFLANAPALLRLSLSQNQLDQKQITALPNQAQNAIERYALISHAEAIMDPKNQANPGAARIENWERNLYRLNSLTLDELKNLKVIIPTSDPEELKKVLALPIKEQAEAIEKLKRTSTIETTLGELVKSTVGPEDID